MPIPNYTGDMDHLAVDQARHRLLIAGEDQGTLEVFDLATRRHWTIHGQVRTPHYVFVLPEIDRVVVTDAGYGGLVSLDAQTYARQAVLPLGEGADSAAYDQADRRLYVVTGGRVAGLKHCTLVVVDPVALKVLGRVPLPSAHAEAIALDLQHHRLFVNLTDRDAIAVVDTRSLKVSALWPVGPDRENSPLAFDSIRQRLFVVSRAPGRVIVVDARNGRVLTRRDAPARVNGAALDPASSQLFLSGGDGRLFTYDTSGQSNELSAPSSTTTAEGAKTEVLAPQGDLLFLARSPGASGREGAVMIFKVPQQKSGASADRHATHAFNHPG